MTSGIESKIVNMDVHLEDFDYATSLDLKEARKLICGRKKNVSLEVLRRW